MPLNRKTMFVALYIIFLPVNNAFSATVNTIFQGQWKSSNGTVDITHCKDKKCKMEIITANGAYTCELDGKLFVLTNHAAVFRPKSSSEDSVKEGYSDWISVTLSKTKKVITVSTMERIDANKYCGAAGYYDDEYTNTKYPRIYPASFNCDKAKTAIELAICQSSNLAYADKVLANLYINLKEKHVDSVVNGQKQWISERDNCLHAKDLTHCLLNKYSDRILELQKTVLSPDSRFVKKHSNSYNYDYLVSVSKNEMEYSVFSDPPLQNYLDAALPKEIDRKKLDAVFTQIQYKVKSESMILITGAAPGLYTICEGALLLSRDQTWLAFIDINSKDKTQLNVVCPKNINCNALPPPLKQWVKKLLPHMKDKKIVYRNVFS